MISAIFRRYFQRSFTYFARHITITRRGLEWISRSWRSKGKHGPAWAGCPYFISLSIYSKKCSILKHSNKTVSCWKAHSLYKSKVYAFLSVLNFWNSTGQSFGVGFPRPVLQHVETYCSHVFYPATFASYSFSWSGFPLETKVNANYRVNLAFLSPSLFLWVAQEKCRRLGIKSDKYLATFSGRNSSDLKHET